MDSEIDWSKGAYIQKMDRWIDGGIDRQIIPLQKAAIEMLRVVQRP